MNLFLVSFFLFNLTQCFQNKIVSITIFVFSNFHFQKTHWSFESLLSIWFLTQNYAITSLAFSLIQLERLPATISVSVLLIKLKSLKPRSRVVQFSSNSFQRKRRASQATCVYVRIPSVKIKIKIWIVMKMRAQFHVLAVHSSPLLLLLQLSQLITHSLCASTDQLSRVYILLICDHQLERHWS